MLANNVPKMVAAGARLVLGTDAGITARHAFGWADHHEIARWVELGLTPAQAIAAATARPAELLGIKDLGTLATGKSADFIVLDANPLENIRNTRKIAERLPARRQAEPRCAGRGVQEHGCPTMNTRRQFLITAPLGVLAAAAACRERAAGAPAGCRRRPRPARRRPSAPARCRARRCRRPRSPRRRSWCR